MGMSKSSGACKKKKVPVRTSSTTVTKKECFVVPASTVEEVVKQEIDVITPGDVLDNQDYVANTVAATQVTTETSEIAKAIAAYAAVGSNITVTFYHALNADTEQRTWQTDFAQSLDDVHYSYLRIENFQMKLQESMSFSYETGEVRSQLTGSAILYPYFCPLQGDLFIYQVDSSHLGLFRIYEAPERMSIKESTVHQIKFILMAYLTPEMLQKLNKCVSDNAVFDITRYTSDEGALLTTDEASLKEKAQAAIDTLLNAYNSEFYETTLFNTYIESECLYDPYIVEFITKVVPLDKMPGYPTQLKSNPVNWKRSFWFKLLSPQSVPDTILISYCFKVLQEVNYRTAGINALANKCYIAIMADGTHPYPPFRIPTEYDATVKTLPMQVRLYFDEGKVNPTILLDLSDTILTVSRRAQFYYIPIIIFLLQKMIDAINNGTSIVNNPTNEDATAGDCAAGCLNCIYNCNPLENKQKLCPGTLVCECHHCDEYISGDGTCTACDCCTADCTESSLNS